MCTTKNKNTSKCKIIIYWFLKVIMSMQWMFPW